MERTRQYPRVVFTPLAIQRIVDEFRDAVENPGETVIRHLSVDKGDERWRYDTLAEFLAELRAPFAYATLSIANPGLEVEIRIWLPGFNPTTVAISSSSRERILRLGNLVDSCAADCFIPEPPQAKKTPSRPRIFVGHGGSPQWRELKDHLTDLHGYDVLAYETGSRAGHTIRDVVSEMLEQSSFAVLVMTGEDRMEDGTMRARQNVIHEIGLFQGRLGFSRAIVLKEEGTEEFSNLLGVNQIRYARGNIKESFGELLGVLRREFGEQGDRHASETS